MKVGVTLNGSGSYKTFKGGFATLCLKGYILYFFIINIIPWLLNEIQNSSTEYAFQDVDEVKFNPFQMKDFDLALGAKHEIDESIATFHMEYVVGKYNEETE